MILVTGATGTTGNAVARKLLKMGQEIRVFVRDPEKAREMGLGSAEIIEGDFNNADSVKAALDGVDKAYMVFYAYPDLTPLENGFVDRGKESGVEHIVRLSVLQSVIDHNLQLGKIHREREKCLEDSGIAWTHLHPHFFMQNYIRMKDVIKNKKAIFSPITDARVCPVDVEDIGEVAAIALTQSGHESKTYEL
ncbi:MAG TPA: NmrA family NAD(P)-binding protein, partial [bacterium]